MEIDLETLWQALLQPLLRLVGGLCVGLLIANLLECLHWTRFLARLAAPLARIAHLRPVAGAAFALAFVSPAAANGLLSQNTGELRRGELVLANVFNSLPSYLVHTPTIFFLVWPVLGWPAVTYIGLTLLAAAGRTVLTIFVARAILPAPVDKNIPVNPEAPLATPPAPHWREAVPRAWRRFIRRVPRLLYFTVPVYVGMYALQRYGFFQAAEQWLAEHIALGGLLKPQAMGIIVLHLAAELGAALAAAGSVLHSGALDARDIVLALLVGNILSTPMRAVRHQLPSYAGFFRPRTALILVCSNQGLRALSMLAVTVIYAWCS